MEIKQTMSKDNDITYTDKTLPVVTRSHRGVTGDDSFVKELTSITKGLKNLFSKTGSMTELIKAGFNDVDESPEKNCKENERSQKFVSDRISELESLLPLHENIHLSGQTTIEILSETINYIKLLKKECDQSQAVREKIKNLCMQCVTMTIRLKHLQDMNKKENVPVDADK
ncbi:uncharacterized protein LOC132714070 isoform X2 [Ruditapes philippinarum]|uniref:uncharacterized protein LOC132714070 isoform X2 n=1 Tax=Ruditapes philippinarum TaxID=129788 RepID=UPI00295A906F|nr:uncharacterized protein LOC132714070 isoform X2 [Ruditapes philippinarum]